MLTSCVDDIVSATIWTVVESNVTIISACLIVSRPFFVTIYSQKLISLIQEMSTKRSFSREGSDWKESSSRPSSHRPFKPLTDRPLAVTNISLGILFEGGVEKSHEPQRITKAVMQNEGSGTDILQEPGSY